MNSRVTFVEVSCGGLYITGVRKKLISQHPALHGVIYKTALRKWQMLVANKGCGVSGAHKFTSLFWARGPGRRAASERTHFSRQHLLHNTIKAPKYFTVASDYGDIFNRSLLPGKLSPGLISFNGSFNTSYNHSCYPKKKSWNTWFVVSCEFIAVYFCIFAAGIVGFLFLEIRQSHDSRNSIINYYFQLNANT